jgi:hypothetical protein
VHIKAGGSEQQQCMMLEDIDRGEIARITSGVELVWSSRKKV